MKLICDFRYVLQVLLDLAVHLDHLDRLVLLVTQGHLVLQDSPGLLEEQELVVSQEHEVQQDHQVLLAQQA